MGPWASRSGRLTAGSRPGAGPPVLGVFWGFRVLGVVGL